MKKISFNLDYIEPDRPYSNKELIDIRETLFKRLRLGNTTAYHSNCDHFYFVKENGRKEKEILKSKERDIGNCSVCWKLRKTPNKLQYKVLNLIDCYCKEYNNKNISINHKNVFLELSYYSWLYEDINY